MASPVARARAVNPREAYEAGRSARSRELSALDARASRIATVRLALAAAALVLVGVIVWARAAGWAAIALAAVVAGFLSMVFAHARVHAARERAAAALRFHERGLARLEHAWDRLPASSARFAPHDHPFAGDLDVFGRASLMQLVDVTETRLGQERLAAMLSARAPVDWPTGLRARQAAVRELAERFAFREQLSTAGGVLADERPDPAPLLAWAEGADQLPAVLRWLAWLVPAALTAALVLDPALHVARGLWPAVSVVALLSGAAVGQRLGPMLAAVSARQSSVTRWRSMIQLVEREAFDAPWLVGLRDRLAAAAGGADEPPGTASAGLGALERLVGF